MQVCSQWWGASAQVAEGGLATGILGRASRTLGGAVARVRGRDGRRDHRGCFTLGIGSGSIHSPADRQTLGLPDLKPLGTMRDYLTTLRALLAGETVTYEGTAVTLREFALAFKPPRVPVVSAR